MFPETNRFYDFGDFRLDLAEKILVRSGKPIPITPKVYQTLCVLLEDAGRLIEKDELMRRIWQDRFVEESNLTFNIKMLRKALGDAAQKPTFIETVPRRGYRFIAEVRRVAAETEAAPSYLGEPKSYKPPISPAHHFTVEREGYVLAVADWQTAPEKISNVPRAKKSIYMTAAFTLIGIFAFGVWYAGSKNTETGAPVLSAPFALEKLSTNGRVFHAAVSPDGKNVVYTNGNTGGQSVWHRNLETGNNVEIIPPSDDFYGGLAFSPDGNFLFFSRSPKTLAGQLDIYRVSIFGGVPQKIVNETQGWIGVSPDGGKISFVRCYHREDENCSLWIADSADGKNERKLAARPRPFRIGDNEFSTDGKSIVFAAGQSENQANDFGLSEVSIESGAERQLTAQNFFNIKSLARLPGSRDLLITASRISDKNFRIWQVFAASGDAVPLTNDSETYSILSLDREGDILVSTQVKQEFRLRIYQTENAAAPRILADAESVAFAPNGKIIFSSRMTGNDEIWSSDAGGGGQRQLTNNAAGESTPVASPDNNSIFFASNRTGEVHVWRMNADGSNQTQITHTEGGFPLSVSPDGKWLYYHSGRQRTLWRVAVEGGEEQLILNKRKYYFAVSPDGLQIAFSENQGAENVLTLVSLVDGQTIKTFNFANEKARLLALKWSPNGENLIYILAENSSTKNALWQQPLDGKPLRRIADLGAEELSELSGFALAPDGKSFAAAQGGWLHDAVLLRGLK